MNATSINPSCIRRIRRLPALDSFRYGRFHFSTIRATAHAAMIAGIAGCTYHASHIAVHVHTDAHQMQVRSNGQNPAIISARDGTPAKRRSRSKMSNGPSSMTSIEASRHPATPTMTTCASRSPVVSPSSPGG